MKIKNLGINDLDLVVKLSPDSGVSLEDALYQGPWRGYGLPGKALLVMTYDVGTDLWLIHQYASPEYRGLKAKQIFRECLLLFFQDTGAQELFAKTPMELKHAVVMLRSLGFRKFGEEPGFIISILKRGEI